MTQTTRRTVLRRIGWTMLTLASIVVIAAFVTLSRARVEMTEGGAYTRLLLPVVRGAIGVRVYSGGGEQVALPGYLAGPMVRRGTDGRWSAKWFCADAVQRATGQGPSLQVTCAGRQHTFSLATAPSPAAVAPMPDNVTVLSDLEGNSEFLEAALRKLGVVDDAGAWRYGDGHLVILGDSVDRGREVFAVLWRLHGLAVQAHAAGGAVHVLLGNHEQYLLRGNVSRAHPEYRYALQQLGGYTQAFADDSVLGGWLRGLPVALKLGPVLFTHAGISPALADTGLSIQAMNAAMRDYWCNGVPADDTTALEAAIGRGGVTQYRGYFRAKDAKHPAATQAQVEHMLALHDATHIVVGHTLVEKVTRLYNGRVIGVDVNHPQARPEVLVFSHGEPRVVDIGIPRGLAENAPRRLREFSLFDARDRQLLASMYRANRALADIPYPY